MALSQELVSKIREDFPKESVQVKTSFKNPKTGESKVLTGYKPQYIIERMNDVFGHEGWDFEVLKYGVEGKDAWVLGRLTIYEIRRDENSIDGPLIRKTMAVKDQFGSSFYNQEDSSYGDALKGAATNSFEKCCSFIDIGHLAYKGLVLVPENHPSQTEISQNKKEVETKKLISELREECQKHKINKDAFPTLVKTVLKQEKSIDSMNGTEIAQLISHLKTHGAPF